MTASMQDEDLLLQAYCDGELDVAAMADVERRLAASTDLRRRHDRVMALRQRLRAMPQLDVPAGLERRIAAAIGSPRVNRRWAWQALAASVVVGIVAGSAGTIMYERTQAHRETASLLVGNHIRSVLASQPFDIASSDRHTVKPWFTSRLPESPQVVDLAAAGFVLAGGRVDVVGQTPVATVVYRRGAHLLSLTMLSGDQTVPETMIAGYRLLHWRDNGVTYVAVSDLPAADMAAFQRAFIVEVQKL
jgi:anti-sigma factor RsiW